MILKIFMCPCYKNGFFDLGNSYFSHCIHMRYMCQRRNFLYVHFSKEHRFGSNFVPWRSFMLVGDKCKCKDAGPQEICNFCVSIRYILNFKCHKICVNELPDVFIDKVVPLDEYLKKINYDPFFYLSKNTGLVKFSLDNPEEPKIPAQTDCI